MLFYGVYNGYGKNTEKVTSGNDPALVSQERILSLLPHCDFEDTLKFLVLTPLNTNVTPNWGWSKPPQRLEWNKKTQRTFGRLGQPSHPWQSRNGALGINPCSEPLWLWSSRSSQGSHPTSHEVKGLRFKARKYILKS